MEWRVGFPEAFRSLDDEHEALARMLAEIRLALDDPAGVDARSKIQSFLKLLNAHIEAENGVMELVGFPERDVHVLYHVTCADNVETVLQFFDGESVQQNRAEITKHLENRLAEELQFDRLLLEYLKSTGYYQDEPEDSSGGHAARAC